MKCWVTGLAAKGQTSATLAYGPADDWIVRQLVRDLEDWGRRDVRLQTDGEPAMIALQQAIVEARKGETAQRHSLADNLQSNGGADQVVQDVSELMRRTLLSPEAKVRGRLDLGLPWARWLIQHAALVFTRYRFG